MADNNKISFTITRSGCNIQLRWMNGPTDDYLTIKRMCALKDDTLLLLTVSNCLYIARFLADTMIINLQLLIRDIIDLDYCAGTNQVFIVTQTGIVLTSDQDINELAELKDDTFQTVIFDPLELSQEGIRIRRVCCSAQGTVFVTTTDEIYVAGNCGKIFNAEAQPKHLRLRKDRSHLLDIVAGDEYFVLLMQQKFMEPENARFEAILQQNHPNDLKGKETMMESLLPLLPSDSLHDAKDNGLSSSSSSSSTSTNATLNRNLPKLNNYKTPLLTAYRQNLKFILQTGYELIHTKIYTFGATNNGLLGTGDHIKRTDVQTLDKLKSVGVLRIAAGREHSVAETLDGNFYVWGMNTRKQLSIRSDVSNVSTPTSILDLMPGCRKDNSHFLAVACLDYATILVNCKNEIEQFNKVRKERTSPDLSSSTGQEQQQHELNPKPFESYPLLLASGMFTLQHSQHQFRFDYFDCLVNMQNSLRILLQNWETIRNMQMFLPKRLQSQIHNLLNCYEMVVYLHGAIVQSMHSYYCNMPNSDYDQLVFVRYQLECIELFRLYSKAFCDYFAIDGFTELKSEYVKCQHGHQTQAKAQSYPNAIDATNLVILFQQPFQVPDNILGFLTLYRKVKTNSAGALSDSNSDELKQWQSFFIQNKINIELAENTQQFWQHNQNNIGKIQHLKDKSRRVVLTSTSVPLKLKSGTLNMSNTMFILFSDCVCQVSSQVFIYPLATMWVKDESDICLRIITPERVIVVVTRNSDDKILWYNQLQSSISQALREAKHDESVSEAGAPQDQRNAVYVFSKNHPKYAGVRVCGSWQKGILHGECYMEFPSGKLYFGNITCGEIDGYGRMLLPAIGLYEGTFKEGKFHGNGILKAKNNEIYEGNFREGMFHGHGCLHGNSYTHIGEYKDNQRFGYGVLDDMVKGEKYMGMFTDGKRSGIGICITMHGDYFEGVFQHDELMGAGVAMLENDYYFEGEMTLHGPNGKGTYYMPYKCATSVGPSTDDDNNSNDPEFVGNILTGQLTGNWEDVRIVNGSMAVNKKFPKYPKTIGKNVVDNERKWQSLFETFEEQIFAEIPTKSTLRNSSNFGKNGTVVHTATKHLWKCITKYMVRHYTQEMTETQHHPAMVLTKSFFKDNIKLDFFNNFDKISLASSNRSLAMPTADSASLEPTSLCHPSQRSHSLELLCNNGDANDSLLMNIFGGGGISGKGDTSITSGNSLFSPFKKTINDSQMSLRSALDSMEQFNERNLMKDLNRSLDFECMPDFGVVSLNQSDISSIKDYLEKAFKNQYHPLYRLSQEITNSFYTSYGCWTVKPTTILASQAICEWETISRRVYKFIRIMFPALPEDHLVIESPHEVISHQTLLYPILLSEGIYSTLFVLYANKFSHKDELYRQNCLYAETLSDEELGKCLALDSGFLPVVYNASFKDAIETLKLLQNKYNPKAMLNVIEQCMQQVTDAYITVENSVILTADGMMPLSLFLILRAGVPHFGAELALLEDLASGINFQFEMNGMAGYCYTTLKASYEHIATETLKQK